MENIFKDTQVSLISNHLGIYKTTVESIISEYVSYLRGKIDNGESVKVLNICFLRVNNNTTPIKETLAYISYEIAERLNLTQNVVYRVLSTWEEFIIRDLQKFNSCSIRGLIRVRLEKDYKGDFVVRTKKSTVYNGKDVYVTTLPGFKRKAEVVA